MRFSIVTFGCRVNQADSCRFEEELRACGGSVASADEADLVVVNTCSVTASADQGSRQTIRRIARRNPHAKIVVTGCYATRSPEEVRALPGVVRVFRNEDKERLVSDVVGDGPCGSIVEPGFLGRTAYPLRIQTGCDEPCSYCIIPSTRGAPRSLPVDRALAEVERLTAGGFKEIILTGVHLGSYGRDLTPPTSLGDLLRQLAHPDALEAPDAPEAPEAPEVLFRISSLEPMDCTDDIVDLVAANRAFAPHFHLPLQHASDRILRLMRRPYTIQYYRRLVDRIRRLMPHASIGTDLIVGFPGETADDFEILRAYLEDSPLTHLHVFPYSDRPGIDASTLGGKVGGIEIRDRSSVLRAIGQRLTAKFRRSQVGSIRPAITIDDGSVAVTDNYLKLKIPPGHPRNARVLLRVTCAGDPMQGALVAPACVGRVIPAYSEP